MGWYAKFYGAAGPGVSENEPKKKGLRLLGAILLREWRSLMLLNLLFLLFSLPVITIPAAACSMQHLTIKMVQDEPFLLWTDFTRKFRSVFVRASLWGWGYVLACGAVLVGLSFYWSMTAWNGWFIAAFLVLLGAMFLLLAAGVYLFPLLIRSDMNGWPLVKNALMMAMAYFPHAAAAVISVGALSMLCELFFLLVWPVVLLALFSLESLLCSLAAWPDIDVRRQGGAEDLCTQFDDKEM